MLATTYQEFFPQPFFDQGMTQPKPQEFDLTIPAPNGLRRGRTTGTCATAAVKAALLLLLYDEYHDKVDVTLPEGAHYLHSDWSGKYFLSVPIETAVWLNSQTVRADVIKDAGDDADNTHSATLFAEVTRNDLRIIRFFAGAGVGTVTKPGIRVQVGEPAINPVPRQMMEQATHEVLAKQAESIETGFDLTIGCENGEAIARKTFNPRLGIVGGISILGTSGIVEPMSLASWIASIEVYVRVALADHATAIAFLPGKIARTYAKDKLKLPTHKVIEIANFLGDALDFTQKILEDDQRRLDKLWLAGHPGKLAKVLDDVWDTHSSKSNMAMKAIAKVAKELDFEQNLIHSIETANTVEEVIQLLKPELQANIFWSEIEHRIAQLAQQRAPSVKQIEVRLFDLRGNILGADT